MTTEHNGAPRHAAPVQVHVHGITSEVITRPKVLPDGSVTNVRASVTDVLDEMAGVLSLISEQIASNTQAVNSVRHAVHNLTAEIASDQDRAAEARRASG